MKKQELTKRILVVEDDERLAEMVASFLSDHDFRTTIEGDGGRAVTRILHEEPDLVVLDVMLPAVDGFTICRRVRAGGYAKPILMLTARSADIDEVEGLEDGADDYVRKPVRPRVLLARINALLRRKEAHAPSARVDLGRLVIDPRSRVATLDQQGLVLTDGEFELLLYLARRAGTIVSRDEIYRELRGIEYDGMDRSVDLRISRIRRKLNDTGGTPSIIRSVRGVGYLLAEVV
ncbi:MAG: response regulator transcription factor [Myxococcota bacterium]